MRWLEEKQKNIERTEKYAIDQNVDWWSNLFNHQHTILDNHLVGYWPLQYLFTWNIGVGSLVSMTRHHSLENTELNNLVCPRQRDIACGTKNITYCRGKMARQFA